MVTCTDTSWTTQLPRVPPQQDLGGLWAAHTPRSETLIAEAREHFRLLRHIHSLNCVSFPKLPSITTDVLDADLADDITILRSDIKSLPIRLQQIDIDQVTSDSDLSRLIEAFGSLLAVFESAAVVKTAAVEADIQTHQDFSCSGFFPKLATLCNLRRQQDDEAVGENSYSTDDATTSFRIHLPPPHTTIAACRRVVESFGRVITDVFSDGARLLDVESLLQDVTDDEIKFIREAHAFGEMSSSLFSHLVDSITCGAEHAARLHLSGFHTQEMEILLSTCNQDRVSVCFARSPAPAPSERGFAHRLCAPVSAAEHDKVRTIRAYFDGTAVWEDCVLEQALCGHDTLTPSPDTLEHLIQGLSPQGACKPYPVVRRLDRIGRKIFGVLLANSLLQLSRSPWLQHEFEGKNIFVLPRTAPVSQLCHWCPHISCDLSPHLEPRSLAEDVAALGVMLLELEANRAAEWDEEDEDYETATRSNRARLARIMKDWKGDLPDRYHGVGTACFMFEQLVEDFDHTKIDQSLRDLAVLYKCVVNPLYQQLVSEFGAADRLFPGIPGPRVSGRQNRPSNTGPLVLYDDSETTEFNRKSEYAEQWMNTLKDGFINSIGALRQNSVPIGFAERLNGKQTPEHIRIAVLDTGVDPTDVMIKRARSRIIDKRSWVGPPENCDDTYGHGTHVARLLLSMAPAAQLFVAKITDNKHVHPSEMSNIAEAIDWAVEKWDVDIISMSFGFESQNKAIDAAIDRAFKADKLMFAAASNEGGNKRRSRPARSPQVICMHACDGKGNKGDMSPSPMSNRDNFTTLGVAVPSKWKKKTVYKSGTSFAAPVAAAFAADILEFANFKCDLSEEHRRLLYRHDGMSEVFREMSTKRDGYDYVQPGSLWDGRGEEQLARKIGDILDGL